MNFVILTATTHVSVKKLDFVAQNIPFVMMILPHTNSILQLQELMWELTVRRITFILKVWFCEEENLKGFYILFFLGAGGSKNSIVGPNRFCGQNLNFVDGETVNEPIVGKIS